jgi:hypothetical protein
MPIAYNMGRSFAASMPENEGNKLLSNGKPNPAVKGEKRRSLMMK